MSIYARFLKTKTLKLNCELKYIEFDQAELKSDSQMQYKQASTSTHVPSTRNYIIYHISLSHVSCLVSYNAMFLEAFHGHLSYMTSYVLPNHPALAMYIFKKYKKPAIQKTIGIRVSFVHSPYQLQTPNSTTNSKPQPHMHNIHPSSLPLPPQKVVQLARPAPRILILRQLLQQTQERILLLVPARTRHAAAPRTPRPGRRRRLRLRRRRLVREARRVLADRRARRHLHPEHRVREVGALERVVEGRGREGRARELRDGRRLEGRHERG